MVENVGRNLVANPMQALIALALVLLLGWPIAGILSSISRKIDENPPDDFKPEGKPPSGKTQEEWIKAKWKKVVSPPDTSAGVWLGLLERTVFFAAIVISSSEIIFAWLAFKVASKWAVWQNIVKVPDQSAEDHPLGVSARRALGSRVMQRFLIGTLGNLLAAIFGALVFAVLLHISRW